MTMKFAVQQSPNSSSIVDYASHLLGLQPPIAVYDTREAAIQDAITRNSRTPVALALWNGSMQHYKDFLYLFVTQPKYAGDRKFSVVEI